MKSRIEYVVHVGGMEWGTRSVLEEGMKLYEDAKENNSDCFIALSKVTFETLSHEFERRKSV